MNTRNRCWHSFRFRRHPRLPSDVLQPRRRRPAVGAPAWLSSHEVGRRVAHRSAPLHWEGKAFEWVRRQSNYCRRQGLVFSEADREALSPADWDGMLRQINEVWPAPLAGKSQAGEIQFLEGSFDPARIGRKRIFLATAEEGRGRDRGYSGGQSGRRRRRPGFSRPIVIGPMRRAVASAFSCIRRCWPCRPKACRVFRCAWCRAWAATSRCRATARWLVGGW